MDIWVQWAALLAVAAAVGYLVQRRAGLPKVVGYTLVGTVVGLLGFGGTVWPLTGTGLFLMEFAVGLVLFECGGRLPLRWLARNPMVLVQSVAESLLTWLAVYSVMRWLGVAAQPAGLLALVATAASPTVLVRVVADTRAAARSPSAPSFCPRSRRCTCWRWARRARSCSCCPGAARRRRGRRF